ncbi:MAG: ABC transporter ATP-binding protein [Ruminiclostridium sp.]|nr:ABC transporter ATP-binding protein [Ruminiclostridium sp.]
MSLLKKLLIKRIGLVTLTVIISISAIVVSLWWNSQLSAIINMISTNILVPTRTVIIAAMTILISMGMAYLLNICSGWTCETLAHDLRMGSAKHLTGLPITEIENLNAGEQLSRLQNEIGEVSRFLRDNLFAFVDDLVKFIGTFSWMLWLNPRLTLVTQCAYRHHHWLHVFFQQGHWKGSTEEPTGERTNERFCRHTDFSISNRAFISCKSSHSE